ncbi:hypothetical protein GCM10018954_026600 [Kutzneria kofuensis]
MQRRVKTPSGDVAAGRCGCTLIPIAVAVGVTAGVRGAARHGRPGLRRAGHRRLRSAGTHGAWIGAAVNGAGVVANAVGGVLALLLLVYLFVALIKPEKF